MVLTKEKLGNGSRDGCSGTSLELLTETFRKGQQFKWEPPSGAGSEVQTMGDLEFSQIHSSRIEIILYIIAVSS